MSPSRSVLVVAGEVSGDMHAGALVRALRASGADVQVRGVGGDRLRAEGAELLYDVRDTAVMGFSEVVRRLGFFRGMFRAMLEDAGRRRPDLAVLVDYPGFNLRFARALHARGIRVLYYICPQVWAWHRSRIPRMARDVDRLLVIFPFEVDAFAGTGLRVDFVGHPLVDEARTSLAEPPAALPWAGEPRIALLPGSRRQEVERILPDLCAAAARIERERPGASFIVAAPSEEIAALARQILYARPALPKRLAVVAGQTRQVLRQARAAWVASGTATVETCLMDCPMVVVYRTAALTYLLGRMLVRVDHIGMVNLVAGRRLCPELIQDDASPDLLAGTLAPLLDDGPARRTMLEGYAGVRRRLGDGGAAENAARIVRAELGLA